MKKRIARGLKRSKSPLLEGYLQGNPLTHTVFMELDIKNSYFYADYRLQVSLKKQTRKQKFLFIWIIEPAYMTI